MTKSYKVGDSSIYAEIILDYKNKTAKFFDPKTKKELTETSFTSDKINLTDTKYTGYGIFAMFVFLFFSFVVVAFNTPADFTPTEVFLISIEKTTQLSSIIIAIETGVMIYLFGILMQVLGWKYNFHKFWQCVQQDIFSTRKVIRVQEIKNKIWKLPYNFENRKLDFSLYGEFERYLNRVHIKPEENVKVIKAFKKQEKEPSEVVGWDAVFYFEKVPKTGWMKIVFI